MLTCSLSLSIRQELLDKDLVVRFDFNWTSALCLAVVVSNLLDTAMTQNNLPNSLRKSEDLLNPLLLVTDGHKVLLATGSADWDKNRLLGARLVDLDPVEAVLDNGKLITYNLKKRKVR